MRYTASIYVNDVMDQVVVCARVYGDDGLSRSTERCLDMTEQLMGTGESEPRQWLMDALVGLIEAL